MAKREQLIGMCQEWEIVKEGALREKTLHRNMLYPFWSVEEADNPLLLKCNILMDIYFNKR